MATITICDRCGIQEGVWHDDNFDLCHPCAMQALAELGYKSEGEKRDGYVLADAIERRDVKKAPLSEMEVDALIKKRRAELFMELGCNIYAVTPEVAVKPKQRIQYGAEKRMVEIIEEVPWAAGKWFAKVVE